MQRYVKVENGQVSVYGEQVEGSFPIPARDASRDEIAEALAAPAFSPVLKRRGLHMIKDRAAYVEAIKARGISLFD